MRPIKYDAIKNDLRLMEMALYEVTKGQTNCSNHETVIKKLAEYKGIIKRGTFTIDQLEDRVFSRFGVLDPNTQRDTELYDLPTLGLEQSLGQEMGPAKLPDELSSLFSGFFRKSQGLSDPPTGGDDVEETRPLHEIEEAEAVDEDFSAEQLLDDFPESPEFPDKPDDELDPDDHPDLDC
jgi:hypothetical protein